MPLATGENTLLGTTAWIMEVAAVLLVLPAAFVAVTTTESTCPTSVSASA